MRKLLLGLLTILLLGLSIYIVIYGLAISKMEINSVASIREEDTILENKIQEASRLKSTEYPQNVNLLESAYKKLMTEKSNYEQILALGVDENGQPLNKIQEYEIEKIWVTMGNYAKKQGVELQLDVTSNNPISGTYDLKFTVTGGYIQITDFLYDVERDNTLVFMLENFRLVASENTNILVGTFTCKNVKLNITNVKEQVPSTTEDGTTTEENNSTATESQSNGSEGNSESEANEETNVNTLTNNTAEQE